MNGKSKCKILKDIRRQIAAENDIAYVTSECKYQGDCTGTCPKCEAEVRYLEEELAKRRRAGKAVAVAGVAAAVMITASGCDPQPTKNPVAVMGDYPAFTEHWTTNDEKIPDTEDLPLVHDWLMGYVG